MFTVFGKNLACIDIRVYTIINISYLYKGKKTQLKYMYMLNIHCTDVKGKKQNKISADLQCIIRIPM